MKYSVEFLENVKGDTYEKLIDYAFEQCDQFGLICRQDLNQNKSCRQFIDQYKDEIFKFKLQNEWPGTIALDMKHEVYYFKTNQKTRELLRTNRSLFEWQNPNFPEDLFFIRRGKGFLSSNCYEGLASIVLDNENELELFENTFNFKYKVNKR